MLQSAPEMSQMGTAAFAEMKSTTPISNDTSQIEYVRCVADAITSVLTPQEMQPIAVSQWEVVLFEEDSANAFALPGGKMGVHTGLLRVAQNQSQLATVMGHEVAHVLAQHGNERVSQTAIAQLGLNMVGVIAGADTPEKQQALAALGVPLLQVGVLMPFGREQESEADELGLYLMARAGFDPRESVPLWQNMGRASAGQAPPEFLSTHPSHENRIERLNAAMPKALELQQQAIAQGRRPRCR
jgi:predicted Zn-dependent protease